MADENETENKKPQFELRDTGEIHYNRKGKSQLLAKYDDETGVLTLESFMIDQKYRTQICRAVMEDWVTGELSGNSIKAYAIAGRPIDKVRKGEPPPPKKNKMLGDKTPEFVKWLFKWRPQAAYARYGVFLDSNGEPITAHCIREEQGMLKPEGARPLEIGDRALLALGRTVIEREEAILASRASCMTFLKKEQVGYEEGDDEDDDEPVPGFGRVHKADSDLEKTGEGDEDAPPNPRPSKPDARRNKPITDDAPEGDEDERPTPARRPSRKPTPAGASPGGED